MEPEPRQLHRLLLQLSAVFAYDPAATDASSARRCNEASPETDE